MKRCRKYILLYLSIAFFFLFESCALFCEWSYNADSYLRNNLYDGCVTNSRITSDNRDIRFYTPDTLLIMGHMPYIEDNIKHLFKGREVIYAMRITGISRSNQSKHPNDTIKLNNIVIIDEFGDTIPLTIIQCLSSEYGDTIKTLPFTYIMDSDWRISQLDLVMVSRGYWKMPKNILISYDLEVNNYVLQNKNIKYQWTRDCLNVGSIFHIPLLPIYKTIYYFLPNNRINSIYSMCPRY